MRDWLESLAPEDQAAVAEFEERSRGRIDSVKERFGRRGPSNPIMEMPEAEAAISANPSDADDGPA
jgi:hypothetical protein